MEDPLSFEMLAASLRADAADLGLFLEVLAAKLSAALPSVSRVEHQGGIIGRRRVRRIQVDLGEHRYEVGRDGAGIAASRSHAVRGITLRSEAMTLEHWIEELARHLAEHAQASAQDREALTRLLQP